MAFLQEECFLFELLSELGEFLSQVRNLPLKVGNVIAKCGNLLLQVSNPFSVGGRGSELRLRYRLSIPFLYLAGQKMNVASLLGAGLPGKNLDERGLALHQVLQAGLHGAQVVERMHALGPRAKFARRLRAAQQQDAEDGDLVTIEVEGFLEAVLILGDAAVDSADIAD